MIRVRVLTINWGKVIKGSLFTEVLYEIKRDYLGFIASQEQRREPKMKVLNHIIRKLQPFLGHQTDPVAYSSAVQNEKGYLWFHQIIGKLYTKNEGLNLYDKKFISHFQDRRTDTGLQRCCIKSKEISQGTLHNRNVSYKK